MLILKLFYSRVHKEQKLEREVKKWLDERKREKNKS